MSSVRRPHGRLFQIRGPAVPKLLSPEAVVCTWHRTHVIRGRPKGCMGIRVICTSETLTVTRTSTNACNSVAIEMSVKITTYRGKTSSNNHRVPNKCRVSSKRRGSEARVLFYVRSRLNAGSQINARVFKQYRIVRVPAIH